MGNGSALPGSFAVVRGVDAGRLLNNVVEALYLEEDGKHNSENCCKHDEPHVNVEGTYLHPHTSTASQAVAAHRCCSPIVHLAHVHATLAAKQPPADVLWHIHASVIAAALRSCAPDPDRWECSACLVERLTLCSLRTPLPSTTPRAVLVRQGRLRGPPAAGPARCRWR